MGIESDRCTRCGSRDIRHYLTLREIAFWGCRTCNRKWYASKEDPARLVEDARARRLPQLVVPSLKPPISGGPRRRRRGLAQWVFAGPVFRGFARGGPLFR